MTSLSLAKTKQKYSDQIQSKLTLASPQCYQTQLQTILSFQPRLRAWRTNQQLQKEWQDQVRFKVKGMLPEQQFSIPLAFGLLFVALTLKRLSRHHRPLLQELHRRRDAAAVVVVPELSSRKNCRPPEHFGGFRTRRRNRLENLF